MLDITTNTIGTCLAQSPDLTNALIDRSCWNGFLTTLNVPSMYQDLALARFSNWWSVAKIKWRRSFMIMSPRRNPSGMASWISSKVRSWGSFGRWLCLILLAVLAKQAGAGSAGHGVSGMQSSSTCKQEIRYCWKLLDRNGYTNTICTQYLVLQLPLQ